jgi:superoxide dismutase, Cu-Zn family
MHKTSLLAAVLAAMVAAPLAAQEQITVNADVIGAEGDTIGSVKLTQAPTGVMVTANVSGLPEGAHGFHFHETGVCEPPFESAGGHFNPADTPHGFYVEGGPHAGDMPNVHVGSDGQLVVEAFNPLISLQEGHEASLLDEDGSALVVHAGADDYTSQPSGEACDRLACAVIGR